MSIEIFLEFSFHETISLQLKIEFDVSAFCKKYKLQNVNWRKSPHLILSVLLTDSENRQKSIEIDEFSFVNVLNLHRTYDWTKRIIKMCTRLLSKLMQTHQKLSIGLHGNSTFPFQSVSPKVKKTLINKCELTAEFEYWNYPETILNFETIH